MNDDSHLYEGEGGYHEHEPKSEAELERQGRGSAWRGWARRLTPTSAASAMRARGRGSN